MQVDPLDKSVTEALRAWSIQHNAGVGVADALRTSAPLCRLPVGRECFNEAAARATAGAGIDNLLLALAPILSEGERSAIAAGWNSGRVEPVMNAVIEQRELWAQSRSKIRARMALPVIVLLMAALISPLPALFLSNGGIGSYLFSVAMPLGVAYVLWRAWARLMSARANDARMSPSGQPAPPTTLDTLLISFPIVDQVERQRNISEFSSLLSVLISSGVSISLSLDLCARALVNGFYREEIMRCVEHVKKGNTLSSGLAPDNLWPAEYISALEVGEKTGTLDEALARMAKIARERYTAAIEAFADWLPRIAYGMVALFMVVQIFRMVWIISGLYTGI